MTELREALGRLSPAPESPRFFEKLRARLQEDDRRVARRWRRIGIAAVAAASAAVAAAGVVAATRSPAPAGGVLDRTVSCTVPLYKGSVHRFMFAAQVATGQNVRGLDTGKGFLDVGASAPPPAPNEYESFLALNGDKAGYQLGGSSCRGARPGKLPLARGKLPLDNVYTPTFLGGFGATCRAVKQVEFRAHVAFDAEGKPRQAAVALWSEKGGKPRKQLGYFTWTRKRVVSYLAPNCPAS